MALPGLEVGHGQRPVERRVHRHGDDHVSRPVTLRRLWRAKSKPCGVGSAAARGVEGVAGWLT
jgi:hypothetical protein